MKANLLTTSALAILAAMMPMADALPVAADRIEPPFSDDAIENVGDDGDDEFGDDDDLYDENGTLTDNPDRPDHGDIGEQGEYREGEYGERDDTGWNPPPADNAGESGALLEGLGEGGEGSAPSSGTPLINGLGQGGSSGGLLE